MLMQCGHSSAKSVNSWRLSDHCKKCALRGKCNTLMYAFMLSNNAMLERTTKAMSKYASDSWSSAKLGSMCACVIGAKFCIHK